MPALNIHLTDTASPPVPEARAWARAYDGALGPLINLSQAAPADAPHTDFTARLAAAAREAESARYGSIFGDPELRTAYARDVSALAGAAISPEQTAITPGANQAFFTALMLAAKAGDNILLPAPWYFNHEMAARMLGIEARALACDPGQGFQPDSRRAAAMIDTRTRAIILVSPNNPSGAVYPPGLISAFARLCRERGIWLILDSTYRDFLPETEGAGHDLFRYDGWDSHVIELYSFSKAYCIPGLRLGAMIAAERVIEQAGKVFDTLQICPARIGQIALAPLIEPLRAWRRGNARRIAARAEAFSAAFGKIRGWRIDSIGAYFAYARHPYPGADAALVTEALARQRGVLALPGTFFGPDQAGHVRLAFANADEAAIAALPERFQRLRL